MEKIERAKQDIGMAGMQGKNEWEKMADEVQAERGDAGHGRDEVDGGWDELKRTDVDTPQNAWERVGMPTETKEEWLARVSQERKAHKAELRAERREVTQERLRGIGQKVLQVTGVGMMIGAFDGWRRRRQERAEQIEATGEDDKSQQEMGESWDPRAWEEEGARRVREREDNLRQVLEEKARQDRELLEMQMSEVGAMREGDAKRKLKFEQRRLEIEQDLNERLTGIDEIGAAAETGTQADARTMEYDGKEVLVYDMKGYPVAILSHNVGYKLGAEGEGTKSVGQGTAQEVLRDPGKWMEKSPSREFFETQTESGTRQKGNTLSTSYFNTKTMSDMNGGSAMRAMLGTQAVRYGFDHVRPNSLIRVSNDDAMMPRYVRKDRVFQVGALSDLDRLEHPDDRYKRYYNEVAMLRYDEEGKPLKPDYLVVMDGEITDDTLRHAAYFNIPIVNIESKYYGGDQGEL